MFHIKNHLELNISLFFVSLPLRTVPSSWGSLRVGGSEESGERLSSCAAPSPIGDVRVWVITLMVEVVEIWWRFAMVEGSMPGVISDGSTWEEGRQPCQCGPEDIVEPWRGGPMWISGH